MPELKDDYTVELEDKDTMSIKQLLLVDGHGLAFRGFYALPEMTAPDGTPTQAIVGFFSMLLKVVEEWNPDGIGLFFDPKGPTKRHALYAEYKEGRKPTPESFKIQMPLILELSKSMGFPLFIEDGLEADDLIAATALRAMEEGLHVTVLSADKDMFQFIRAGLEIARPTKGVSEIKRYDVERFTAEYGFAPATMADYLALVGDAVDNIPGIPGIGDKTARQLLVSYGSIEGIYDHLSELTPKRRALFEEYRERAFWSRSLVLPQDAEGIDPARLHRSAPDRTAVHAICAPLGLKKLELRAGVTPEISGSAHAFTAEVLEDEFSPAPALFSALRDVSPQEIWREPRLALLYQTEGVYPLTHISEAFLVSPSGDCAPFVFKEAGADFAEWTSRGVLLLSGFKEWCSAVGDFSENISSIQDVRLAHYLVHPDVRGHQPADILKKKEGGLAERAADLFAAWDKVVSEPHYEEVAPLLPLIEIPLSPVLSRMERNGFAADAEGLRRMERNLTTQLVTIERSIQEMTGEHINLNSPKQVGELLFNVLRLPVVRKTKTGFSTDVLVLEELSRLPDPLGKIPRLMLEYRELSKLQSSFVAPYLKLSEEGDGVIRSTFEHAATGTGRLASHNPNVQTVPLFGEWARRFRSCLVPVIPGNCFVAADYSQIELRVLAHVSGEERLLEAFAQGRDVHTETASWVFELPADSISDEQRRFAKVINFGLLYGMSAHGLAQRMGIKRFEAASIVERYFKVFPQVSAYLQNSAKEAKERGYTRSLFGRIRPLSEVTTIEGRGGGSIDRVAVNTPIQSAAADIAKLAMIRLQEALDAEYPDVRLVLQVHDSLVCECPSKRADSFASCLLSVMEAVPALDIPIKAELKRGNSMADI